MITEQFADLGEFLGAVIRYGASDGAEFDRRLVMAAVATGMNERVPSEGGAAVPEEQAGQIWERVNSVGQIIQRCTRQPITTRSDTLSFPSVGKTSRVNGSRYGGLVLRWLDEAEAFPEFHAEVQGLQFAPNKLGGIVHVTGELMADAPALGAWFERTAATEVAMIVEDCIVSGDGLGKPLGIVRSDAAIEVAPESSQPGATVRAGNCSAMAARLWSGSYSSPGVAWLCNNDVYKQLLDETRANGAPLVCFDTGAPTIYGWPVLVGEYTAEIGQRADLVLVDLREYILCERENGVLGSLHLKFLNDEQSLKIRTCVDGNPAWNSPITPKSGQSTQSPIVVLGAR